MSLRPEELARKGIAAGYGNPSGLDPQAPKIDDTYVLCKATTDVEYGDWVTLSDQTGGHPTIKKPTTNEETKWVGVVMHKAASNEWVRVKTSGVTPAKVDSGAAIGDLLEVKSGDGSARKITGTFACGRFLYRFAGDTAMAMVMIGGSAGSALVVRHHVFSESTKVNDTTVIGQTLVAPLFQVWKVVNLAFTGDPLQRLATCIGGGTTHGELTEEGVGWGGVIGASDKMGAGEIGGNQSSGKQGILGAEQEVATSEFSGSLSRINIRSWGGINARDRYGLKAAVVAPIRYSWCDFNGGNAGGGKAPTWWVPSGCDCLLGVTTSDLCDPNIEWWSGTMKLDPVIPPAPFNRTSWRQQWTPQLALERDCCDLKYERLNTIAPDCDLITTDGRALIEANAKRLAGSYESLIPWNYVGSPGRIEHLHATCCHALNLTLLWRSLLRLSDTASKALNCLNVRIQTHENFFLTKSDGSGAKPTTTNCCPPAKWTPFATDCGPDNKGDCEHTMPGIIAPPVTTPPDTKPPPVTTPSNPTPSQPNPATGPNNPGVPPGH